MRRCHRSCAAASARASTRRGRCTEIPNHEAICARGLDDTEPRTPPRSSRKSWATARCRCPDRRPPDHYREGPPTVAVASLSVPMADPSDTLPTDHRFHCFDNAEATQTLWIAAPVGFPPVRRWYALQNSAPLRATASRRDRPHLSPLPCSDGSVSDTCWDVAATSVAPYRPLRPVCHRCPLNYARL